NSGTLIGAAARVLGGTVDNYQLSLDGSSSVSVPNNANQIIPSSGPFSICLWFKSSNLLRNNVMDALMTNESFPNSGFRLVIWKNFSNRPKLGFWTTQDGGSLFL